MEKPNWMENIVTLAGQYSGTIFGGYVRDLIAGDEPKDIDIFFLEEEKLRNFFFVVFEELFLLPENKQGPILVSPAGSLDLETYRGKFFRLQTSDLKCQVDIHLGYPWTYDNVDVSVNQLCLLPATDPVSVGNSVLVAGKCSAFQVQDIIKQIRAKEFMVCDFCGLRRYKKMLGKGYHRKGPLPYSLEYLDKQAQQPCFPEEKESGCFGPGSPLTRM